MKKLVDIVLALNRGEKEKFLTIKVAAPEEDILRYLEKQVITRDNPFTTPGFWKEVTEDAGGASDRPSRNRAREIRSDGLRRQRTEPSKYLAKSGAATAASNRRTDCP